MRNTGKFDYHNQMIKECDVVKLTSRGTPYIVQGNGWVDIDTEPVFEITGLVTELEGEWFIYESEFNKCPLDFEHGQLLEIIERRS